MKLLRTLYGKLALMMMLVFSVIAGLVLFGSEKMLNQERAIMLGTDLAIGALAFTVLASLIVFNVLTRRIRKLAAGMEAFRSSGFTRPLRLATEPAANGDEIDRLALAFGELSERVACQLRQLETNDQQRRELLANVSHDLRTPLASMQGYLELLLIRQGSLAPEEARNYVEVAAKHCERLSKLVRDLFELTKLEANEIRLEPEAFPITELAQDVAQKYQLGAEQRGVGLDARVVEPVPPVRADIGKIERVLENLIENALRHTPRGGSIRILVSAREGRVQVAVSDTGQGIAPEHLDSVFDRYYRASRGEESDGGHAGLGLAISKRIVDLHGGSMRVESRLGAGSTFSFDLPAATDRRTPNPAPHPGG